MSWTDAFLIGFDHYNLSPRRARKEVVAVESHDSSSIIESKLIGRITKTKNEEISFEKTPSKTPIKDKNNKCRMKATEVSKQSQTKSKNLTTTADVKTDPVITTSGHKDSKSTECSDECFGRVIEVVGSHIGTGVATVGGVLGAQASAFIQTAVESSVAKYATDTALAVS